MKVSGFTFVRDAIKYDYPILEAITSILPLCDEVIVNVGKSEDRTLELIASINDKKIKIIESQWEEIYTRTKHVYSDQTNIALSHCTGDWAFYLQADEVVHENDYDTISKAMTQNYHRKQIVG